jgi:hypothetical protein
MIHLNAKRYRSFGRSRELKSISRIWVASAIIAAAISAWGCSPVVESVDDWPTANSSPDEMAWYSPANMSVTSASVGYGPVEDDPAVVRSGHTDPRWERAGEAISPATNSRVLEIPQVLDLGFTDAIVAPRNGD